MIMFIQMNMLMLMLTLGVVVLCQPPCHSSCQECAGPLSFECTTCDIGSYYYLGECLGVFPVKRLQMYDGNPQTPEYITNVLGSTDRNIALPGTAYYSNIQFDFGSLPANHKLQLRIAIVVDISVVGCSASFMTSDGINNPTNFITRDQYYTAVADFNGKQDGTATLLFSYNYVPNDCPSIQMADITLLAFLCDPINCLTCAGSSNFCTSCNPPQYLHEADGKCLDSCANNQFHAVGGLVFCDVCDASCKTCSADHSAPDCLTCDYANHYVDSLSSTLPCVFNCQPGEFKDNMNNVCALCSTTCLTCDGTADICTSCGLTLTGVQLFLTAGTCSLTCPVGAFANSGTNKCDKCAGGCVDCLDATLNTCTACKVDPVTTISYSLAIGTTSCVVKCPAGQYAVPPLCQTCDLNCATCNKLATNCTTCTSVLTQTLYLSNFTCIAVCPSGTYPNAVNPLNHLCASCAAPCLTCFAADVGSCDACKNVTALSGGISTTVIYYKSLTGTSCGTICPAGQFIDAAVPNFCVLCDSACSLCKTSATHCQACVSPSILHTPTSACLAVCPSGFYKNPTMLSVGTFTTFKCSSCHPFCVTCSGPLSTECTSCEPETSLTPGFECLGIPPFQRLQIIDGTAQTPNYLTTLTDKSTYNSTSPSTPWTEIIQIGLASLPNNYQLQARLVGVLDDSISGCTGYFNLRDSINPAVAFNTTSRNFKVVFNFSSNPDNTALLVFTYTNNVGDCPAIGLQSCTIFAYLCDSNSCLTCSGNDKFCTSCNSPLFLNQQTGICQNSCNISEYHSTGGQVYCDVCDISCQTCSAASSSTACLTCNNAAGYVIPLSSTLPCVLLCSNGQYKDMIIFACRPCSTNCLTCAVAAAKCTTCGFSTAGGQLYLTAGTCSLNCPSGTYANTTTNVCDKCATGCLACWGPLMTECTRCGNVTVTAVVIYYLYAGGSKCDIACPSGQFIDLAIPNYCQMCSSLCLLCQVSSHYCVGGTCPSGYYFYNNACMSVCPAGTFASIVLGQCVPCVGGCALCLDATLNTCTACKVDPVTNISYSLSLGTTYCVVDCLTGQYAVPPLCRACDSTCATCNKLATNCTTCTSALTQALYFSNFACIAICPNGTYPNAVNPLNHSCAACAVPCLTCFAADVGSCNACKNVTVISGGISTTVIYYKSATATSCGTVCSSGQFIDAVVPNLCVLCNSACSLCQTSAIYCQACVSPSVLHIATSACLAVCPSGFYKNSTLLSVGTFTTFKCSPCDPLCATCSGGTVTDCTSCHNITSGGVTVPYFKDPTATLCNVTCPTKYFPNLSNNKCDACDSGCTSCSINSSYCAGCIKTGGISYYLVLGGNSCVKVCPGSTVGNDSDFTCRPCPYLTYLGQCISKCPSGYQADVTATTPTCVACPQTNCEPTATFALQTTVAKDGKSFVHRVYPSQGIYHSTTEGQLTRGLSVYVVEQRRGRLLLSIPLSLLGLSISADRRFILIDTNYYPITVGSSSITVDFGVGALVSSSGVAYSSLTGSITLDNPAFLRSYFTAFATGGGSQVPGIVAVSVSFALFLFALSFSDAASNEALSLLQLTQLLGLCRLRGLDVSFELYNFLFGFSYYEFSFLPNGFAQLFPSPYSQTVSDEVAFAFGSHNYLLNFGSTLQVFGFLQLVLAAIYLISRYRGSIEQWTPLLKRWQEGLLLVWSLLWIGGAVLGARGLQFASVSEMDGYFLTSLLLSAVVFVSYSVYYVFWMRPHLATEFFKILNILRMGAVFALPFSLNGALIALNILELGSILLEIALYRTYKRSLLLFVFERLTIIVLLNSTFAVSSYSTQIVLIPTCLGILFLVKLYLIFRAILDRCHQLEMERIDQQASVSINMSVSEKQKNRPLTGQVHDEKLNESMSFIRENTLEKQLPSQIQNNRTHDLEDVKLPSIQRTTPPTIEQSKLVFDNKFIQQCEPDLVEDAPRRAVRRTRKTNLNLVERPKEQNWDDVEIIEIDSYTGIDPSEVGKWEKEELEIVESAQSQVDPRQTMWQTQIDGEQFN